MGDLKDDSNQEGQESDKEDDKAAKGAGLAKMAGTAVELIAGEVIGSVCAGVADNFSEEVVVKRGGWSETISFGVEEKVVGA